jgi:hypothetical protein
MEDFVPDEVKILKCKVCGTDVPVNVNYPITEVTCQLCYVTGTPSISDKNLWSHIKAPTLAATPHGVVGFRRIRSTI